MHRTLFAPFGVLAALAAAACGGPASPPPPDVPAPQAQPAAATPQEAAAFIAETERELAQLQHRSNQAGWVAATYITPPTPRRSPRLPVFVPFDACRMRCGGRYLLPESLLDMTLRGR